MPELGVAHFNHSKVQKSKNDQIEDQVHAELFFRYPENRLQNGLCLKAKRPINTFTERFLKNFEKGSSV